MENNFLSSCSEQGRFEFLLSCMLPTESVISTVFMFTSQAAIIPLFYSSVKITQYLIVFKYSIFKHFLH